MDSLLFIEILADFQDVEFIRDEEDSKFYQGPNGKLVIIDMSDEEIPDLTCSGHLNSLGKADRIQAIFPKVFTLLKK
jgi:hypothetical protein